MAHGPKEKPKINKVKSGNAGCHDGIALQMDSYDLALIDNDAQYSIVNNRHPPPSMYPKRKRKRKGRGRDGQIQRLRVEIYMELGAMDPTV